MAMFGFGGGMNQGPTSAQKIAAAEAELEMVTDMFNRYISVSLFSFLLSLKSFSSSAIPFF